MKATKKNSLFFQRKARVTAAAKSATAAIVNGRIIFTSAQKGILVMKPRFDSSGGGGSVKTNLIFINNVDKLIN